MSETRRLRESLVGQGAELRARYPEILSGGWRNRLPLLSAGAAAIGLYVLGLVVLGISPATIIPGLRRLADMPG